MGNKLASLAKGTSKKPTARRGRSTTTNKTKTTTTKPVVVDKVLTLEEERKLKAREKVKELLSDVDVLKTKKDEENEKENIVQSSEKISNIEWLEEQVESLTKEKESLRLELAEVKDEHKKLIESIQNGSGNMSEESNQGMVNLFVELQNNLLGNNRERTVWKDVSIEYVLSKLVIINHYLETYKKF